VLTIQCAITLSVKCKQNGPETVQKGNPYHHGVQKYRNTSVYVVDITPLHTHIQKNAGIKYHIVMSVDCNLAQMELNIYITS